MKKSIFCVLLSLISLSLSAMEGRNVVLTIPVAILKAPPTEFLESLEGKFNQELEKRNNSHRLKFEFFKDAESMSRIQSEHRFALVIDCVYGAAGSSFGDTDNAVKVLNSKAYKVQQLHVRFSDHNPGIELKDVSNTYVVPTFDYHDPLSTPHVIATVLQGLIDSELL